MDKLLGAILGNGTNLEDLTLPADAIKDLLTALLTFIFGQQIEFIEYQPAWFVGQLFTIFLDLFLDHPKRFHRIAAIIGGDIDKME